MWCEESSVNMHASKPGALIAGGGGGRSMAAEAPGRTDASLPLCCFNQGGGCQQHPGSGLLPARGKWDAQAGAAVAAAVSGGGGSSRRRQRLRRGASSRAVLQRHCHHIKTPAFSWLAPHAKLRGQHAATRPLVWAPPLPPSEVVARDRAFPTLSTPSDHCTESARRRSRPSAASKVRGGGQPRAGGCVGRPAAHRAMLAGLSA